jgi:ferredoxin
VALGYGRGGGSAEIVIDRGACNACGLCVTVCKGGPISLVNGAIEIDGDSMLGCFACGQCVAICPKDCITIRGRDLVPADFFEAPAPERRSGFEALLALMQARRSTRNFKDREVEPDVVDKIVKAAATAPMGIPPSEVGLAIFAGRAKVRAYRDDLLRAAKGMRWFFSPLMMFVMRPFMGKEAWVATRTFVRPLLDLYLETDAAGVDTFFYDAPLAIHFYGTPWADTADPIIAATYATLAAESLGLGSCMLGFPGPMLKNSRKLRKKYNLPDRLQPGIVVVFGYPALKYRKSVKRRFAGVTGM